uniref:RING-type domain-containing protein n=1 Tax=Meloidogyne enterolobii TaxID=390850 RepID=A0A6V7VB92_MELEN|nr:unnamed protein product [Meloidogyne enterolobii]
MGLGRCVICNTHFRPDNVHISLNCHHKYHQNCITPWIEGGAPHCPQCRAPATLDDINQLI